MTDAEFTLNWEILRLLVIYKFIQVMLFSCSEQSLVIHTSDCEFTSTAGVLSSSTSSSWKEANSLNREWVNVQQSD